MRTLSIKKNEIKTDWYLVDADNHTLGRLSSKIAHILRGKNKVNYTPHMDMSDFVVVINADKINLTGNKNKQKEYWHHTGFPGGGKVKSVEESDSEFILHNSIKGMLPHNKLGRKLIKHLKIYKDSIHPHESQCPKKLEL
jgi:large subunit ribosomal protein L13|tara:strand:+ start:413 stop:832 length:420 start_codon:yes stop_codon:yes gene_type:complete